jgi:hypothetical protein
MSYPTTYYSRSRSQSSYKRVAVLGAHVRFAPDDPAAIAEPRAKEGVHVREEALFEMAMNCVTQNRVKMLESKPVSKMQGTKVIRPSLSPARTQ